MPSLVRYRALVNELLDAGVKPTPTEFARRGLPYVTVANDRYYGRRNPRVACPVPGSGTTWSHGRYAQARREELVKRGWTFVPFPHPKYDGQGTWQPPVSR